VVNELLRCAALYLWLISMYADAVEGLLLTTMVVVVGRFGWTTFGAVERKQVSQCVDIADGAHTTVCTTRMSLSRAIRLLVSLYYYKHFTFCNTDKNLNRGHA